ncbi:MULTISPECIES: hypothetical protein [Planktothricoides]|uniref:Transposase n=2 Tax=Planktothricoides TaxID=132607 RepID=A0ABR8EIV6_9CYAN|nr:MULTISPECIES: hypothetical protein [Planktothricoides]KOR37244.1 hypothetical protein AM228_08605 [Planktothricoides sp. SR001]MBD2545745.1 hypothetical protein [Planktothricoides raciborskii FACHB-1370]MBD2582684.1 hypothetical protein [Planktothricoides raciborskii FACHB-1261]
MKRLYVTLTIRQLKAKVSSLSRTAFKVTRNFFQSRLGIVKRDWSRLTKAEIIQVLDYYYGSLVPDLAKTLLSDYRFQVTSHNNFESVLPKLRRESGQQWRLIEPTKKIDELTNSGIPLYLAHFKKVYPKNYQLDIWDNPDCFLVVAEIGTNLYIYVSQQRFYVPEFLGQIKQKYAELMFEISSQFRSVRGENGVKTGCG